MLTSPVSSGVSRGPLRAGSAATALAAETAFEMQRIVNTGSGTAPGRVIGKVVMTDASEGVTLQLNLSELPPGPNRLFLHRTGDCSAQKGELLTTPPWPRSTS